MDLQPRPGRRRRPKGLLLGLGIAGLTGIAVFLVVGFASRVPTNHTATVTVTAPDGYCWSGAIGDSAKAGCGTRTFDVKDVMVGGDVQKETPGRWILTMTVRHGDQVVNTSSTDAEFGITEVVESP